MIQSVGLWFVKPIIKSEDMFIKVIVVAVDITDISVKSDILNQTF